MGGLEMAEEGEIFNNTIPGGTQASSAVGVINEFGEDSKKSH